MRLTLSCSIVEWAFGLSLGFVVDFYDDSFRKYFAQLIFHLWF